MIYLDLFLTFLKIGAFTFGGGYAMIPLIQEEVTTKGWMTIEELINFLAVSESTPGPLAVNIATYIGAETGGLFGSFCATFGLVLPSFIIILLIAKFFLAFKKNKIVNSLMNGLKPCVIGLIGASVISVGYSVFFSTGISLNTITSYSFVASLIIFITIFLLQLKKLHPIIIILLSGCLGIAAGYIQEYFFK